jgi:predicted Zn-dependent protease
MRPLTHLTKICVGITLLLSGCESTNIAPAPSPGAQLESDERRLWARAREEELRLEHSGFLAHAPELETYLDEIVNNLKPEPLPEGGVFRVKVLVDPSVNAFALPDGTIYVHTGMLARLENEAQMATVLAHETTHSTHRHGLKGFRDFKNKTAFVAVFNAGTAGVGGLLGAVGAASAISGYSQDLERDADATGFRLIVAAGYEPREMSRTFELLLAEVKRSKIREPFFFGSHPRLQERIANFQQLTAALPAARRGDQVRVEAYNHNIASILLLNANAAQQAGDLDFAEASARRLMALDAGNADAALLIADVERKRGHDQPALERYRELTRSHPQMAESYRGLGLLLFKQHDYHEAAAAFRQFLALAPNAPDRSHIETFLQQCEKQN